MLEYQFTLTETVDIPAVIGGGGGGGGGGRYVGYKL